MVIQIDDKLIKLHEIPPENLKAEQKEELNQRMEHLMQNIDNEMKEIRTKKDAFLRIIKRVEDLLELRLKLENASSKHLFQLKELMTKNFNEEEVKKATDKIERENQKREKQKIEVERHIAKLKEGLITQIPIVIKKFQTYQNSIQNLIAVKEAMLKHFENLRSKPFVKTNDFTIKDREVQIQNFSEQIELFRQESNKNQEIIASLLEITPTL